MLTPETMRRVLEEHVEAENVHDRECADGRITRETAYYDSLTFMRQLGLTRRP
jgi:hypothetical protein